MKKLACLFVLASSPLIALANPGLTGSWNGTVDGQSISMTVDGNGGGNIDGVPMRYQLMGRMIFIERRGQVITYSWELRNGQLMVGGGDLPGVLVMSKGARAPAAAAPGATHSAGGILPELVGKWCKSSNFSANSGGGSSRSACFELRGNGTYVYSSESSMSANAPGMWGGTASSGNDAGRWSATSASITAQSNNGKTNTYRLEKRNHNKTRDPMLCLDGECYVTYWQKARW